MRTLLQKLLHTDQRTNLRDIGKVRLLLILHIPQLRLQIIDLLAKPTRYVLIFVGITHAF